MLSPFHKANHKMTHARTLDEEDPLRTPFPVLIVSTCWFRKFLLFAVNNRFALRGESKEIGAIMLQSLSLLESTR